jgi:hypothetical protein
MDSTDFLHPSLRPSAFSAVQTFKMYAAHGNYLTTDYSDYTD